jgi:integrase
MGRRVHKLSLTQATKTKADKGKPRMLPDGGGLYLRIAGNARSWLFRWGPGGKFYKGLGAFPDITSMEQARDKAQELRRLVAAGGDPRGEQPTTIAAKAASTAIPTCAVCAEQYIKAQGAGWTPDYRGEWERTFSKDCDAIADMPVDAIDTDAVMRVLQPIWNVKPTTATRARARIEAVLEWAKVKTYRQGENPARWKGHLAVMLPSVKKIHTVKHFEAMPFAKVADFMKRLRAEPSTAARAIELLILTATRTNEVRGAQWCEIDLKTATWTVPAERMKAGKPHRVPLSPQAVALLKRLPKMQGTDLVFTGSTGGMIGENTMREFLNELAGNGYTVHGFRSAFTDWVREQTSYSEELRKVALAHANGDKTDGAYARGEKFEKRRRLMTDWADYCASGK